MRAWRSKIVKFVNRERRHVTFAGTEGLIDNLLMEFFLLLADNDQNNDLSYFPASSDIYQIMVVSSSNERTNLY